MKVVTKLTLLLISASLLHAQDSPSLGSSDLKGLPYSPHGDHNFPMEVYFGQTHAHSALSTDADGAGTTLIPRGEHALLEMADQSILEMLASPRANGLKILIGSGIKAKYQVRDGKAVIVKIPERNFIDDKAGNSDGDFQMLEWTTGGPRARFGLIVHHNDSVREFAYDRDSQIGKLSKGLDEATGTGWTAIDMKSDWQTIFEP